MLDDFKFVVEIVQKLFNIKKGEKQKLITLLDKISDELNQLASAWREIYLNIEHKPNSIDDFQRLIFKQRSHFEALVRFEELTKDKEIIQLNALPDDNFFQLIRDAIDKKGSMYRVIYNIINPGMLVCEGYWTTEMLENGGYHNWVDKELPELYYRLGKHKQAVRKLGGKYKDFTIQADEWKADKFKHSEGVKSDVIHIGFDNDDYEMLVNCTDQIIQSSSVNDAIEVINKKISDISSQISDRKRYLSLEPKSKLKNYVAELEALTGKFRAEVEIYKSRTIA